MTNIEDTNYTETDTNNTNQVQNDIMNNTEDSYPYETWMQSILRAPETDSEDEEVMPEEPFERTSLRYPLREEGICNSLHGTMAFSTGPNQVATANLNQATIAGGEIAWDKPYHSTSLAHFTNEA